MLKTKIKIIQLLIFSLFLIFSKQILALQVILSNPNEPTYSVYPTSSTYPTFYSSPETVTTYTSSPVTYTQSFGTNGGAFSESQTIGVPQVYSGTVYYEQNPTGYWVSAQQGYVPPNALVRQYLNGQPLFYCRAWLNGQLFLGNLVAGDGCYLDGANIRVSDYDVLLK